MSKEITVREWIKKFNNGEFEDDSFQTQKDAGWYDWFCNTDSLSKRLKKMGNIIKDIKNDYILDNYYVWFKNNCPLSYPLYDDFRFEPLDESKRDQEYFLVQCDHPYGDKSLYSIGTARNHYNVEFTCKNKSQVLKVIDKLGNEFKNNIAIDLSNTITEEEVKEMNQLTKNFKDVMADVINNGVKGKTDKINSVKEKYLNFFDSHNFISLKETKWNEFQEYVKNLFVLGGIYTNDKNEILIILTENTYFIIKNRISNITNQSINQYFLTSLKSPDITRYWNFKKNDYLKNFDSFSSLNTSGYLGKISDENFEQLIEFMNAES